MTSIEGVSRRVFGARPLPSLLRFLGDTLSGGRTGSSKTAFVFGVRVASAAILILTQILLARWIGAHEFGVYVYTWTLVIIVGDLLPLGFSYTAQRVIPIYRQSGETAALRGFLNASRLLIAAAATIATLVGLVLVQLLAPLLSKFEPAVVSIAVLAFPAYALGALIEGFARAYDRMALAMLPTFIARPLILVALVALFHFAGLDQDARIAMTAAVLATWASMIVQLVMMARVIRRVVEPGPSEHRLGEWTGTSARFLTAWSLITVYTYVDVLMLNAFSTPDKVGVYFASAKVLALTSFVAYAVASVYAHKFVDRSTAGDRDGLARLVRQSVRLMFWPSLVLTAIILIVAEPLLALFGPEFVAAPLVLAFLSAGLLVRASIGPGERLLSMLGHQAVIAQIYAIALVVAVGLAALLVPRFEMIGAAAATCGAMTTEAILIWLAARRHLGLNLFIVPIGGVDLRRPGNLDTASRP